MDNQPPIINENTRLRNITFTWFPKIGLPKSLRDKGIYLMTPSRTLLFADPLSHLDYNVDNELDDYIMDHFG